MTTEEAVADVEVIRPFMGPEWGIYALCFMQVCAYRETPPGRIEQVANTENPPGTSSPWKIVWGDDPDDDMNDARMAPNQCGSDPARMHYLLSC